ncbi:MAG TPA: GNAT family N-acetyltransferase [Candidatus Limnocylindria bacterium]
MTRTQVLDLESVQRRAALLAAIPVPRRTPMQHEIWVRACAEALNPDGEFEIVTSGDRSSPVAGAVFARRGPPLARQLSLLGAEDLWEPTDVFYRDAEAARSLATALLARGLPVRFGHFPADSLFVAALKGAARGKALFFADGVAGSPHLRLDASWREPEKKFSGQRQRDLRRKRRKAEALGALTFDVVAPGVDTVDALLHEAMAVEAASWKARSRTALLFDDTLNTFFRVYARLASEAGILRFAFLRIGGRAVAVQVGVVSDGAEWQLKIGYDEAYRECSPGNLLMLEVVAQAAALGLESFEFLGKSAPWTKLWTEDERPNVRLRVYPFTARGGIVFLLDAVGVIWRRAWSGVATRLRRAGS